MINRNRAVSRIKQYRQGFNELETQSAGCASNNVGDHLSVFELDASKRDGAQYLYFHNHERAFVTHEIKFPVG